MMEGKERGMEGDVVKHLQKGCALEQLVASPH